MVYETLTCGEENMCKDVTLPLLLHEIYIVLRCMHSCCCFAVVNVSFGIMEYSVSEGTGFVELVLMKTHGAVGPVSVLLSTINGTAG